MILKYLNRRITFIFTHYFAGKITNNRAQNKKNSFFFYAEMEQILSLRVNHGGIKICPYDRIKYLFYEKNRKNGLIIEIFFYICSD